ncbi:hypothetical protein [Leptothoe kymatousa]|nr:hypothetical protein [Leptothoe kymatousa]
MSSIHDADYVHGPGCGHKAAPCHIVNDHLHYPHWAIAITMAQ